MMSLYAKCSGQDQCSVIMQQNFHECQKKVATSKPETILNFPCKNMSFCARSFRMSYIRLEPYHRMEINVINEMINYCCGNCARLKTERIYKDPSNVALEKLNESNFIFPFLAPVRTKNLYGFHFIPIIDTPKLFYITAKRHSPRETVLKLIIACAELWPLFLICILLAVISGFIVWSVETWKNPNEFSRTFHLGLFDGFWWAFVSMTTVGRCVVKCYRLELSCLKLHFSSFLLLLQIPSSSKYPKKNQVQFHMAYNIWSFSLVSIISADFSLLIVLV